MKNPSPILLLTAAAVFGFAPRMIAATAVVPASAIAGRTGSFSTTFAERSPEGKPAMLGRTVKLSKTGMAGEAAHRTAGAQKDYDLAAETFRVYVPATYAASKPAGLLVWCNSGDSGDVPASWKAAADAHNFIIVGADKAGNTRPLYHRLGLALDAVYNLKKAYAIDASRVITTGFSGGGGTAFAISAFYPKLSCGSILIGSANLPHDIPKLFAGATLGSGWDVSSSLFSSMRTTQRYVYISGEKDNLVPPDTARDIVEKGYEKWNFKKKCFYLPVPGIGHAVPAGGEMEKALKAFEGAYDSQKDARIP